ncbi:odorant receptor 22b-like [Maniola hyperantus]|uniref:odorant receptor 22b-like n=1 Tax=Aphantopus hyperantus TaxID=2795564 RepID=UPI0037496506
MAVTSTCQLESLSITLFCWKLLGIWPGENPSRLYSFYTILFLFSTLIICDTTLAVNLFCTPGKIDILLQEVTFFFNVMSITTKVLMVIVYRKRIVELLKILDDETFHGKCDATRNILAKGTNSYIRYRNVFLVMGHFAYTFNSIIPFVAYLILPSYKPKFPTSNYYFLNEDTKNYYFSFIYGYQAFGIYGLMMFDVTTDTFINGCLFFTISQIKALNYKLSNLKPDKSLRKLSKNLKEYVQIMKLNECLKHYDCILKYCAKLQNIINISLFVQYAMGAMIICVCVCSLLLPLTSEEYTFLVAFLSIVIMQIFVPSWLGTQISYESQELVFAAYNSDWIPRTEPFKKSIKIFVERANTPIVMVGLKMFPLSLETFTSIMKTAYSFMTLVRNVQDREEL